MNQTIKSTNTWNTYTNLARFEITNLPEIACKLDFSSYVLV